MGSKVLCYQMLFIAVFARIYVYLKRGHLFFFSSVSLNFGRSTLNWMQEHCEKVELCLLILVGSGLFYNVDYLLIITY